MRSLFVSLSFAFAFIVVDAANGQWQGSGTPVCVTSESQSLVTAVRDNAGGVFIAWADERSCYIYVQHLDAAGVPQWASNGVPVCSTALPTGRPALAIDYNNGVIVAWTDTRNGNNDIYAQRVNSSGAPAWATDGVAVCVCAGSQVQPVAVDDNVGGAVIAYLSDGFLYAQRVRPFDGMITWGGAVCTAGTCQDVSAISNNSGSTILTWVDTRAGSLNLNIFAQYVDPSGVHQWPANGAVVCEVSGNQITPTSLWVTGFGIVFVWSDLRSGQDIFAQVLNTSGARLWALSGVPVCMATDVQSNPTIAPSGSGAGQIAAWEDRRNGATPDIYAQHLSNAGAPLWALDGVAASTAAGSQTRPLAVTSPVGAIIVWQDERSGEGSSDIYVQNLYDLFGGVSWWGHPDGLALCAAEGEQSGHAIVSDQAGGVVAAWEDYRNPDGDIYALRIDSDATDVDVAQRVPSLKLRPIYPSPAGGDPVLGIDLSEPAQVDVAVFDVAGRLVAETAVGELSAGSHSVPIDIRGDKQSAIPSGVYFVRVKALGETATQKLVIVR